MKTIKQQMKIADDVIAKLESFDPTCILAGGAPRDWWFGNLATDLDFFVYWRPEFDNQLWRYKKMLDRLGFDFGRLGELSDNLPPNYKRNPHLICVYSGLYKGEIVQVCFMRKPTFTSVVPMFPFGICQAWYKYAASEDKWGYILGGVKVTPEFHWSVKHKTLRLINDLYKDADGYVAKIRSKFPDYHFQV